jgi:N-acetylmuramoyl-L-alanine amidase
VIVDARPRRRLLVLGLAFLSALQFHAMAARAAEPIRAVRVWPAQDYTRVTFETAAPLRHNLLMVKNPGRLVLDLEGVDLSSVQQSLANKILPNDPYIANARIGQFKPDVVRVVLDLKAEVKPQLFALAPIGEYGNRLVLDVYPLEPVDPLMALLQKPELGLDDSPGRSSQGGSREGLNHQSPKS